MALENSDVFVVQKQGSGEIRKVTASSLNDYLQGSDTVVYKGVGNFTDVGDNPSSPQTGDLWINNALSSGTFAWTPAPAQPTTVEPGDRCIYNGTGWDIINSGVADAGVETIVETAPITVNDADPANPIIGVDNATTAAPGVVQLATAQDLADEATNRVVTADQLQSVIDDLDAATAGGVTAVSGVDPIIVETDNSNGNGGTTTTPVILIEDAAPAQKGAIARLAATTNVGGPTSNTNLSTWLGGLDDTSAVTLKLVGTNFLLADFQEYPDA